MTVDSISPDTGQQGGCAPKNAQPHSSTPAGKLAPGTCLLLIFPMKNRVNSLRLVALACAATCGVLSSSLVLAQTSATPELKEVVVKASRISGPRESQPFGTSVITAQDIQNSGAVNITDAIVRILGVVGRQDFYGGGEYNLDLRGFGQGAGSNQVVVVDGLRINEADLSSTRLAGIPIESVQQIEVIRGSGSVLYGEGAAAGVIIITTKAGAGVQKGNTASVYAGAGSFGLRDLRANASLLGGGFSLDISAMDRKADNYRENFKSASNAVSATGQWNNDVLRVGLRVAQDALNTGLPGALTAAQFESNPRHTSKPNDKASIDNTRHSVFAELELNDWQIVADAGQRTKKLRSEGAGFFGPYTYDYDVKATDAGIRAKYSTKLGTVKNSLVFGTDRNRWQRDVLGAFATSATQTSTAWYLRDELTLAATATDISFGLRTERIEKNDVTASTGFQERQKAWEIGVRQPITQAWSVYGRLGNSFRLANVDEFGFTAFGASLKPQLSRDVELGLRYAHGAAKAEARLYRSAITNEIGFDPNAANTFGPGANVNFDPTRRTGLEVDGSYAMTQALTLRLNAALRQSIFTAGTYAGKDIPLVPRRSLALHADWKPWQNHQLSGGLNWVGNQHPDFDNQCAMPAYSTADVRYTYVWKNMDASLGVSNLMDRKYYTQAFSCVANVTNGIYPEAGRAVNASLRINF